MIFIFWAIAIIATIWAVRDVFTRQDLSQGVKIGISIGIILTTWLGVIVYAIVRKKLGKMTIDTDGASDEDIRKKLDYEFINALMRDKATVKEKCKALENVNRTAKQFFKNQLEYNAFCIQNIQASFFLGIQIEEAAYGRSSMFSKDFEKFKQDLSNSSLKQLNQYFGQLMLNAGVINAPNHKFSLNYGTLDKYDLPSLNTQIGYSGPEKEEAEEPSESPDPAKALELFHQNMEKIKHIDDIENTTEALNTLIKITGQETLSNIILPLNNKCELLEAVNTYLLLPEFKTIYNDFWVKTITHAYNCLSAMTGGESMIIEDNISKFKQANENHTINSFRPYFVDIMSISGAMGTNGKFSVNSKDLAKYHLPEIQ